MKRSLSFILALIMIISLLPSTLLASAAGETVTYLFAGSAVSEVPELGIAPSRYDSENGKNVEYTYCIKTITDYAMTGNTWKYFASRGLTTYGGMTAALTQVTLYGTDTYLALKLLVPATGWYDVTFTSGNKSGAANYYILPGDTAKADILTATEGEGAILIAESTGLAGGESVTKTGVHLSGGEHIFLIESGGTVWPKTLVLAPGEEPIPSKYTYDLSANKDATSGSYVAIADGERATEAFSVSDTDGWNAYVYSEEAEYIQADTKENKTFYQKVGDYLQISMQGMIPTADNGYRRTFNNSWVAIETGPMDAGRYKGYIDYKVLQGMGAADVYVMPSPSEELMTDAERRAYIAEALAGSSATKVGYINCEDGDVMRIREETKRIEFVANAKSDGSKILVVFKRKSENGKKLLLKRIIFDMGDSETATTTEEEEKPYQINPGVLLLTEEGEETELYFADENGNPLTNYVLVGNIVSSDDEIATLSGTIVTAGTKTGRAKLTATVKVGGVEHKAEGYIRRVLAVASGAQTIAELNVGDFSWRNPAWKRDPYVYIHSNDPTGSMYAGLDVAGMEPGDGITAKYCDGWSWFADNIENQRYNDVTRGNKTNNGDMSASLAVGEWVALGMKFDVAGKYNAQIEQTLGSSHGDAEIFLAPAPADPEDVSCLMRDEYKIGEVHQYKAGVTTEVNSVSLGNVYIDNPGDYIFVYRKINNRSSAKETISFRRIIFSGKAPMTSVGGSTTGGIAIGDTVTLDKSVISWETPVEELIESCSISYESLTPEIISVTQNGDIATVTALSNGCGRVGITVALGEYATTGEYIVVVGTAKTRRSYFTEEKIKNARDNIKKYDWAKAERDAAVAAADRYLNKFGVEGLYNFITTNGLPRAIVMAYKKNDTGLYDCVYCGKDLYEQWGAYPWAVDVFNDPWKVSCPSCGRRFPSNDFESFYKLGFDEYGNWSSDLAREENQKLIDSGFFANQSEQRQKYGYLANDLYPEKGEGFAVDDGWGYVYEYETSAGTVETRCEPFIAYYNGWEMWDSKLKTLLPNLVKAYLYTGDMKYGKAGAVMLDRFADVFPDMSVRNGASGRFHLGDGGTSYGKIVGALHDYSVCMEFIEAYDAFWPAFADPSVISFLSQKAEQFNNPNAKTTAEMIRMNIENNFVRQILPEVKAANIEANFGTHQRLLARAAVVLDTMPETQQIVDFVFKSTGAYEGAHTGAVTGGNVYYMIMSGLDRDGGGNEGAALYNTGFSGTLMDIADVLRGYDKLPEEYDLYSLPRLIKSMKSEIDIIVVSATNPNFGNSRTVGEHTISTSADNLIRIFKILKDDPEYGPNIARAIYKQKGGNLDGIHDNIFVKDAGDLRDEIEAAMGGTREIIVPSKDLTGYGIAILRGGAWYNSLSATNNINTQNDFYIWYGVMENHGNNDKLNLGLHAFGLDLGADPGTPALKSFMDPANREVAQATLTHNTVTVEGFQQRNRRQDQSYINGGFPKHFDSTDRVQLMDIAQPEVYDWLGVEDYRRTLVSVDIDDDVSYGVDFFSVLGGKEHTYTFHALGKEADLILDNGVGIVKQTDANGNYVGSYQGIDKGWGESIYDSIAQSNEAIKTGDPGDDDHIGKFFNVYDLTELQFERWKNTAGGGVKIDDGLGTESWFGNVDRAERPGDVDVFSVDWDITDYKNNLKPANPDIGVKLTMVNSFKLDEIATASLIMPVSKNGISDVRTLLATHTGENDGGSGAKLKSLFTSVIEPYDGESLVDEISRVEVTRADGKAFATDEAKAVRVKLTNGREDYIIYSQNNTTKYNVFFADALSDGSTSFEFEGFVGVISVKDGKIIYRYLQDGKNIAGETCEVDAYTGTVTDFRRENVADNYIDVKFDRPIENLPDFYGKYIYINNGSKKDNGAYRIISAERRDDGVRLNIGEVSLIKSYIDRDNFDLGYYYNIASGQTFRIPMNLVDDPRPEFIPIYETLRTATENLFTRKVEAFSETGEGVRYSAIRLPRGATFDEESATISWVPTKTQTGEHVVTIEAEAGGSTARQTFSINVFDAAEEPKITISAGSGTAQQGGTVSIPVTISGNTGIAGLELSCNYAEGLTLIKAERGTALADLDFTAQANLAKFVWEGTDTDVSDGELVVLTFAVDKTAAVGEYEISLGISFAYDGELRDVAIKCVSGVIAAEAKSRTPGDADDNGEVNSRDIIYIRRYIAGGYGVTINESAADVDANGEVNSRDIIYIRRYIAGGYGIELK